MQPQRETFDPHMEVIQREVQRLLVEYEARRRRNPNFTNTSDPEEPEEHHTRPDLSSDEDRRPPRFGEVYQRRERRPPDQPHRDYGVKVEIPTFDGGPDPDDFIDWLQEVDRVLEYKEIPLDRQVKLVAIRLKKGASLWWENPKRARQREGKRKIANWEKMKELQKRYLPSHYKQDVFWKLHHIQQKDMTVGAYTAEFEQLMMKCDLQEPEEHTITRYLGGLRPNISNVVQLQSYWTLLDVQKLAVKVERQQKQFKPFPTTRSTPGFNLIGGTKSTASGGNKTTNPTTA